MIRFLGSFRRNCAVLFTATVLACAIPGVSHGVQYPDRGMHGLHPRLKAMLNDVGRHFGKHVVVVSGCRSRKHNRRVGGARESYHLRCMAADIYLQGVGKYRLWQHLMNLPGRGGVGTYCRASFVHIDIGPRREWAWGCGRKYKKRLHRMHHRQKLHRR